MNFPYNYRNTHFSGKTNSFVGSLPPTICGANQGLWMSSSYQVYSGITGTSINNPSVAPCYNCVTHWGDNSSHSNSTTLLNSASASAHTANWPDYWTGDTTINGQSFISFDRHNSTYPEFLNVPYNSNFAKLKTFTFSSLFRARQVPNNKVTYPDGGQGSAVNLFQHGSDTTGGRGDGWGIDFNPSDGSLRCWYYDISTVASCDPTVGNTAYQVISDWTKWIRFTVRVSGNTIQMNVYNQGEFAANSGFTWINGCNNGHGVGVTYPLDTSGSEPQWFMASQQGPDFPGASSNQTVLNGSWDVAEYFVYDNWLPDPCVQTIWNYYKTRYGI